MLLQERQSCLSLVGLARAFERISANRLEAQRVLQ
jgi:hypothetical protein